MFLEKDCIILRLMKANDTRDRGFLIKSMASVTVFISKCLRVMVNIFDIGSGSAYDGSFYMALHTIMWSDII